jgi:hypothetical protein
MTGCQGRSDDELSAQERDEITEAIKQRLDWYREARSKARLVGLKRSDIAAAIAEARRQE